MGIFVPERPGAMLKHISSRFSPLILIVFLLASCESPSAANQTHLLPRRNIHPTFLNSMHMFDRKQGWALGNDPNTSLISSILRTSDGQNWTHIPSDSTLKSALNIDTIQFVSETVGWVSGRDQQKFPLLLKTIDG